MAENIQAVGLLLLLCLTGIAITFNVPAYFGINLGIGFNHITSFMSGFWTILVRIVGIALTIISVWAIFGILREG